MNTEKASFVVSPHFKGIVNCPEQKYLDGLVYGVDSSKSKLLEDDVLKLIQECPSIELITDVRRAIGAALFAVDARRKLGKQGLSPLLAAHEGCIHRVGDKAFRGAQLMRQIWETHVPQARNELEPPMISYYSDCTSKESERAAECVEKNGMLTVVTDAYHQKRSEKYLHQQLRFYAHFHVVTPQEIQQELSMEISQRQKHFYDLVVEIVEERFSREGVRQNEEKAERVNEKLRRFSRVVKKVLPSFDFESSAAKYLRSDERLKKQLFQSGEYLWAIREGLPSRG